MWGEWGPHGLSAVRLPAQPIARTGAGCVGETFAEEQLRGPLMARRLNHEDCIMNPVLSFYFPPSLLLNFFSLVTRSHLYMSSLRLTLPAVRAAAPRAARSFSTNFARRAEAVATPQAGAARSSASTARPRRWGLGVGESHVVVESRWERELAMQFCNEPRRQ